MPATIACRACHSPLLLRPESLGHTVRCPSCGNTFVATQADVLVADKSRGGGAPAGSPRSTPQRPAPQRAPAASRNTAPRHVVCPACQEPMLDDGTLAGQMVECVRCSHSFQMPGSGARPAARRTRVGQPSPQIESASPAWRNYVFVGAVLMVMVMAVTVLLAIQQRVTQRQVAEQPVPENQSEVAQPASIAASSTASAEVPPAFAAAPSPPLNVSPFAVPPPEASSPQPDPPAKLAASVDTEASTPQDSASAVTGGNNSAGKQGTVKEIVDRVDPSIVRISVPGVGLGSGFVVDEKGTIITNWHVIAGATRATVVFSDKTQVEVDGFTAVIPNMDLAALRIVPQRTLRPLPLAKTRPDKGEQVLAFGAPQGLSFSVSDGIVSAVRPAKEVQEILKETTGRDIYQSDLGYSLDMTWVQTSTPISPGNSGGPLVNLAGEVVGINTWGRTGENLNFAISAEHVSTLLRQASGSPQPFSQLPKPRVEIARITKSQVERTQQYWNQIYDAHQEMLAGAKKEKKKGNDGAKWTANAKRLRKFAVAVKKIDSREVDLDLVVLTTALAQSVEEIATALEDGANALPKGKLDARTSRSFDYRKAYSEYQWATRRNRDLCRKFDYLRVAFVALYSVEFRVIFDLDADDEDGLSDKK